MSSRITVFFTVPGTFGLEHLYVLQVVPGARSMPAPEDGPLSSIVLATNADACLANVSATRHRREKPPIGTLTVARWVGDALVTVAIDGLRAGVAYDLGDFGRLEVLGFEEIGRG